MRCEYIINQITEDIYVVSLREYWRKDDKKYNIKQDNE